jgi:hypothetical protein
VPKLLAALAVAAALLVSCSGGDDALSLDDYFEQLAAIDARFEEDGDAIDDPFDTPADASLEDRQARIEDARGSLEPVFEQYEESLADLDPPDEVRDQHDNYVAAMDAFIEAFEQWLTDLEDAPSNEEFDALLEAVPVGAAAERAVDACNELQSIADDSDINVDLKCDGGEVRASPSPGSPTSSPARSPEAAVTAVSVRLDEYFRELERIESEFQPRGQALGDPSRIDKPTAGERREAIAALRQEASVVFMEYLAALGAVEPPAEAAARHRDYTGAIKAFSEAYDAYFELAEDTGSLDDIQGEQAEELIATLSRVNQRCFAMQEFADSNDIEVDLDCEG